MIFVRPGTGHARQTMGIGSHERRCKVQERKGRRRTNVRSALPCPPGLVRAQQQQQHGEGK